MISHVPVYTDIAQLAELKNQQNKGQDKTLEQVAQQFESVFTHMVIKSMRDATLGNDLFNSNAHDSYRDMFDRQIALTLSQGKGLGIADSMLRQLGTAEKTSSPVAFNLAPAPVKSPADTSINALTKEPQSALPATAQSAEAKQTAADNIQQNRAALRAYGAVLAPSKEAAMQQPFAANGLNTAALDQAPKPPSEVLRLDQARVHSAKSTPEGFIARVWPAAQRIAEQLGVSPRVLVAQAALETGWGRHMPKHADGSSSNNMFGIKTHNQWDGASVKSNTTEIINGVKTRENSNFRAYDSIEASFQDFVNFLTRNPRYKNALENTHNPEKFVDALQKAGYATDPNYADKIKSIMNGRRMRTMIASNMTEQAPRHG